jgi:hypothetical protein
MANQDDGAEDKDNKYKKNRNRDEQIKQVKINFLID